jgi:hypothetical protein
MKERFNIYYHFAGTFIPSWLLSRPEISAGAKLTHTLSQAHPSVLCSAMIEIHRSIVLRICPVMR